MELTTLYYLLLSIARLGVRSFVFRLNNSIDCINKKSESVDM